MKKARAPFSIRDGGKVKRVAETEDAEKQI